MIVVFNSEDSEMNDDGTISTNKSESVSKQPTGYRSAFREGLLYKWSLIF